MEAKEFELHAARKRTGLLREFLAFLNQSKKWWLLPIVVTIVLLGGLLVIGGTGAGAFIYTLF